MQNHNRNTYTTRVELELSENPNPNMRDIVLCAYEDCWHVRKQCTSTRLKYTLVVASVCRPDVNRTYKLLDKHLRMARRAQECGYSIDAIAEAFANHVIYDAVTDRISAHFNID